jgi:glycosyltransferase involved in cell wall biosynthesis
MSTSHLALSVVVPVHDEERTIAALVEDLERDVVPVVGGAEVIVVDDASTDATPAILAELRERRPWLRVERLEPNVGHGRAVRHGLELARGEWVFGLDSDGQFVVSEFARLWDRREEADLVLGIRERRHDPRHRLVLSRLVATVSSLLAGRRIRDANTPFRLLRRRAWDDLRPTLDPAALAPNVLVTVGAGLRGWRVAEIPVTHLAREGGTSTLRSLRLLRFSLRGLWQLVAYRRRVGRSR